VEAENAYKHNHADVDFRNNFGSSGTLAREIEDGAPVDAFLSAASKPMDDLQAKGLVAAGTRQNLLRKLAGSDCAERFSPEGLLTDLPINP